MRHTTKTAFIIITLTVLTGMATADFAGGSGTSSDPFEISNCVQLQEIENGTTGTLSDSYELVNDIDCSNSESYDGGTGFDPIGSTSTPFDGDFDGRGHIIRNIYVNASEDAGLFSHLGSSGIVKRTRQIDSFINGTTATYSGGFVGDNSDGLSSGGTINDVEFDGTVIGNIVGGIAGRSQGNIYEAETSGNISSFSINAAGGIVGTSFAGELIVVEKATNSALITSSGTSGGIIGRGNDNIELERTINYGSVQGSTAGGLWGAVGLNQFPDIRNSFSIGNVTGSSSGGLIGEDQFADVKNVYWDVQASTQVNATSSGNETGGQNSQLEGLTTSEMTGSSASTNIENLSFSDTFETVTRGIGIGENGYPIFQDLRQASQLNGQGIGNFSGGDGSSGNSLEVNNCHQLQDLQYNLTLDYELVSDVDCSKTENRNNGKGFDPVGGDSFSSKFFNGSLDGRGKKISQLYINRSSVPVGLFSNTRNGLVKNLTIDEARIVSTDAAGTAAGFGGEFGENTEFRNIKSSGNVSGDTPVGGLVGSYGRVVSSRFEGNVSGDKNTGGLIGGGAPFMEKSSSNATVRSVGGLAGGLVGFASSTTIIKNSSTFGSVKITGSNADRCAGGIAGGWSGTFTDLSDSFAAVEMSTTSGCLSGVTDALVPSTISDTYWDTQRSGVAVADNDDGNVSGAEGLTTSEMQGPTPRCQGTMSGLDFRNTWAANESAEYPQLKVFVNQRVSSVSNSDAPKGALWVQDNTLHWADGSDEYFLDFQGEAACDVNGDNGGFWVQGSTLRWIDQDGDERIYEGSKVQDSVSGPQGATWFQNGFIHYIDGNGDERRTDGF